MIRDVYFVYFLAALSATVAVAYGVRVATRGVVRNERVARIGGTALVGQGVMDWTYWAVEPVVKGMVSLGVTPNGLTWSALGLGLGAGVALGFGWFGLACLLATCSTIGDILDGQVARMTETGSDRGELLDACVDRYTEFAFLGGLVMYYRDSATLVVLVLAAIQASFTISYASAKAEALQITPPRGLMRRHERAVYLLVGVGLSSLFGDWLHDRWDVVPWTAPAIVGVAAVAVIGNAAAILRLVRISRALPLR